MKWITIIFLLCSSIALAQDHGIAHFSVWNPKPGQSASFEDGYKHHLLWHKANKDSWNWYGWYIISGWRTGQFIDITVGHLWADFDNEVNPAGDEADNQLHTEPFADYLRSYKGSLMPFSDADYKQSLTAKMVRMLTVDVSDIIQGAKIIEKVIADYKQKNEPGKFVVFDVIDGGNVKQYIILIPLNNMAQMERTMNINTQLTNSNNVITGITSETLLFQPEMSINVK